jgi:two-component system, LuxR family, sensor kinase FixL
MLSSQLLAVMDAAVDAVVLIDRAGRIEAFNRAAERIFGWNVTEVIGQNVKMLMPEPERSAHDGYLARYAGTGSSRVLGIGRELSAVRRDGSRFPMHLSLGRVNSPDGSWQFVGFIRDLTAEKQSEAQARVASERLMQVSRMATMGEMAAGIAHELNQPLTAIANYAHASRRFLEMAQPDLEEVRDAMGEISSEALRAGAIIRRLREMVRGGDEPRQRLSIDELIDDLRQLTLAEARVHDTRVSFDPGRDMPELNVHRIQILQLLLNFVRNALESLDADQPRERAISVCCRRLPSGDCEIAVCDNGPGVAPEILDRMFEPFRTMKKNGTGLGLPMSQTIAQAHGGSVRHEPAPERGACFILRLPAAGPAA